MGYCSLKFKKHMDFDTFDTDMFQEICDAPGEIFNIPEMQDQKFDVEGYINSNYDYWYSMSFVSTFDHSNSMTDNIIDREELQNNLINQILDDMDIKTMMAILYDNMNETYDKYSVDELIQEVEEYYPELLEEW